MIETQRTKLSEMLKKSNFESFGGEKIGLPLYFHALRKNPKNASDEDAYQVFRLGESVPHQTRQHILKELPKTVL